MIARTMVMLVSGVLATGCASLPEESPPLFDMEVSLAHMEEPDDERERRAGDLGSFTGLVVASGRASFDEMESSGLRVIKVMENSPADAAGLQVEDYLISASRAGGEVVELSWPSQWGQLEREATPGQIIEVHIDRAGVEQDAAIHTTPRVRPAGREEVDRYRESKKVGIVLRTATEVEARAADLGPGGGAVVVGLARTSPWRAAGIQFGDLIIAVNGTPVHDPRVVIDAIDTGDQSVTVTYIRDGETFEVQAVLSRRAQAFREFDIPILVHYKRDPGESEFSILYGLFGLESTQAAWRCRILWLISFGGGDADRLEEVANP